MGPQPFGRAWGIALVAIGAWLLLERLGAVPWSLWDLWPFLLVALGGSLIVRSLAVRRLRSSGRTTAELRVAAILGSAEPRIRSDSFRGGEVVAIMGGCKVDLRDAQLASAGATLDTFALMGGIEIFVPQGWAVDLPGNPILEGCEDKTRGGPLHPAPRLTVTGTAIMGGVEVKS